MGEEPKSTKRARLDGEDTTTRTIECGDLYFLDGTIILRAYSAPNNTHTLFRVHKSILAMNSVFFRDLFDVPSSTLFEAASAKYAGLPVMDMQDDPQDLEDFLRALYVPG